MGLFERGLGFSLRAPSIGYLRVKGYPDGGTMAGGTEPGHPSQVYLSLGDELTSLGYPTKGGMKILKCIVSPIHAHGLKSL